MPTDGMVSRRLQKKIESDFGIKVNIETPEKFLGKNGTDYDLKNVGVADRGAVEDFRKSSL